jgi:CDGSH-type Zn-finger protein
VIKEARSLYKQHKEECDLTTEDVMLLLRLQQLGRLATRPDNTVECGLCGQELLEPALLLHLVETHYLAQLSSLYPGLACSRCPGVIQRFKNKTKQLLHMLKYHMMAPNRSLLADDKIQELLIVVNKELKTSICRLCDLQLTDLSDQQCMSHLAIKHFSKELAVFLSDRDCLVCDRSFLSLASAVDHVGLDHGQLARVDLVSVQLHLQDQDVDPNRTFPTVVVKRPAKKSRRKTYIGHVVDIEARQNCSLVEERSSNSTKLETTETGQGASSHICRVCGVSCSSPFCLKQHLFTHFKDKLVSRVPREAVHSVHQVQCLQHC